VRDDPKRLEGIRRSQGQRVKTWRRRRSPHTVRNNYLEITHEEFPDEQVISILEDTRPFREIAIRLQNGIHRIYNIKHDLTYQHIDRSVLRFCGNARPKAVVTPAGIFKSMRQQHAIIMCAEPQFLGESSNNSMAGYTYDPGRSIMPHTSRWVVHINLTASTEKRMRHTNRSGSGCQYGVQRS
jgi:hypothetical protein